VNDPVSLDTIPESYHGQASGVTATAEQGGGAFGIAVLYAIFHSTYLTQLSADINASKLPSLSAESGGALKAALQAAEQTGLNPSTFSSSVAQYLLVARDASDRGYAVTFLAMAFLAVLGFAAVAWLVRKPPAPAAENDREPVRGISPA
jgi:hypothetical protein